jgi:hypothetical protein
MYLPVGEDPQTGGKVGLVSSSDAAPEALTFLLVIRCRYLTLLQHTMVDQSLH